MSASSDERFAIATLAATTCPSSVGRRPAAEFRAALARNRKAVDAMRATKRSRLRALGSEAVLLARTQAVTALTTDACVLYAAKVCAESGVMVRDAAHGLPGEEPGWRTGPSAVFTRGACAAAAGRGVR